MKLLILIAFSCCLVLNCAVSIVVDPPQEDYVASTLYLEKGMSQTCKCTPTKCDCAAKLTLTDLQGTKKFDLAITMFAQKDKTINFNITSGGESLDSSENYNGNGAICAWLDGYDELSLCFRIYDFQFTRDNKFTGKPSIGIDQEDDDVWRSGLEFSPVELVPGPKIAEEKKKETRTKFSGLATRHAPPPPPFENYETGTFLLAKKQSQGCLCANSTCQCCSKLTLTDTHKQWTRGICVSLAAQADHSLNVNITSQGTVVVHADHLKSEKPLCAIFAPDFSSHQLCLEMIFFSLDDKTKVMSGRPTVGFQKIGEDIYRAAMEFWTVEMK